MPGQAGSDDLMGNRQDESGLARKLAGTGLEATKKLGGLAASVASSSSASLRSNRSRMSSEASAKVAPRRFYPGASLFCRPRCRPKLRITQRCTNAWVAL